MKFCLINAIGIYEFRCLMKTLSININHRWNADFLGKSEVMKLSKLLDEKPSIVNLLGKPSFEMHGVFGTFSISMPFNQIRPMNYCPECILKGYHATFHDAWWLRQCPIHHVDVINICVADGFGARVDYLKLLLSEHIKHWRIIHDTPEQYIGTDSKNFREFARTMSAIRRLTKKMKLANLVNVDGTPYLDSDLGILLGRIQYFIPIPKNMRSIFRDTYSNEHPTSIAVAKGTAEKLKRVLINVNWNDLSIFCRKTSLLHGENTQFFRYAKNAVQEIYQRRCRFENGAWGWSRVYGWERVIRTDGYPSEWRFQSIHEYAAREIAEGWVYFATPDTYTHNVEAVWGKYLQKVHQMVDFGYAVLKRNISYGEFLRSFEPVVELNLDDDLLELIQQLLLEECITHVESIMVWLNNVEQGSVPYETRESWPSSTNLFFYPQTGMMVSWRRTTALKSNFGD